MNIPRMVQKKIDIVVNNAGANIPEHFTKVQKKNMEYLVKLNTVATFNIAQLCTLKMLEAKVSRSRTTPMEQEESQESDDISISPIGIPLIAGPGAITASMLLSSQIPGIYSYATLGLSILLVLSLVYLILRNGDFIMKAIGYTGMRIIQRLMGLVLMVIAVQFVINGIITIVTPLVSSSL